MPVHNWNQPGSARCRRCGATRTLVLGQPRHPLIGHGKEIHENRARGLSPFDYRLPDGLGTLEKRPPCAGRGTSRTARRNGMNRRILAASRAGGARLLSKEEVVRRERAAVRAGLLSLITGLPYPPAEDASPTLASPEPPAAS